MPAIPHDYAERVYAGVLGKLIGVYLGRPFEGWTYERIMQELGPINFYVNDRHDVPGSHVMSLLWFDTTPIARRLFRRACSGTNTTAHLPI